MLEIKKLEITDLKWLENNNIPEMPIKFELKYGISKKGNKTVTVVQIPNEKYPFKSEHGFRCDEKFKNIIGKAKNIADYNFFKDYYDMTVESVFEIAFKQQNWKFIPVLPTTNAVHIKVETIYSENDTDWND